MAESIRLQGEAEAFAIEVKAKAEAEQMAKKADAWNDYEEAAKVCIALSNGGIGCVSCLRRVCGSFLDSASNCQLLEGRHCGFFLAKILDQFFFYFYTHWT